MLWTSELSTEHSFVWLVGVGRFDWEMIRLFQTLSLLLYRQQVANKAGASFETKKKLQNLLQLGVQETSFFFVDFWVEKIVVLGVCRSFELVRVGYTPTKKAAELVSFLEPRLFRKGNGGCTFTLIFQMQALFLGGFEFPPMKSYTFPLLGYPTYILVLTFLGPTSAKNSVSWWVKRIWQTSLKSDHIWLLREEIAALN